MEENLETPLLWEQVEMEPAPEGVVTLQTWEQLVLSGCSVPLRKIRSQGRGGKHNLKCYRACLF